VTTPDARRGVEPDEFLAFLRCGFLAGGFVQFRCTGWMTELLVAFSLACARCGGRLRLIATLEASDTRGALALPTEVPPPTPARAPPGVDDWTG